MTVLIRRESLDMEEERDTRHLHRQRDDAERTQREGGRLQATGRGLRNPGAGTLTLDL